jgi:uncharacterized protein YccT (UPF0319 family)
MSSKVLATWFVILLLLSSPASSATSHISIPEEFNLISLNGQEPSSSLIQSKRDITLHPGINLLALEYEAVFDDDENDSFDIITSDIFIVSVYVEANMSYQIRFLRPHMARAARIYATQSQVWFESSSGKTINHKQWFANTDSLSAIHRQTRKPLNRQAPIILKSEKPKTSEEENARLGKTGEKETNKAETLALSNLQYWWKKASPEEKRRFLRAIKDSDAKENNGEH